MRTLLRLSVFLVLCVSLVWAQADANKGQIVGTIFDANRAVIAGAKIKIKNVGTGFVRELTSDESGQYRAVLLDPGSYELVAESQGLAASTVSGIVLNVGSTAGVDVVLQVQAVSTVVDVGDTLINIALPAPSTVVGNLAITNLPINGRRFQDFAVLTPTVQVTDGTRNQLSFAGQRGINSNVMLDGADYNQPFFGGIRGGERSNSIITVPQAAVQEFQVVTTGYSAEYGRSTGGVMNTVTKSGNNDYRGELFYQLRHRELSGKNPIFNVQPSETLQQFGGGVGGPIKRDKLFFFAAAEGQRSNVPRQVFFPALTGLGATANNREALEYYRSLEQPFRQTNRAAAAFGRIDYQFANGDRLTARYGYSDSEEKNAVSVGGALNPFTNSAVSNEGNELDTIHQGTVQYTKILSAAMVNDLRFTGSAEVRPRLANAEQPTVSAGAIGTFGTRSFLPTTQSDKRWQITDGLTVNAGKHSLKVGMDYSYLSASQAFGFNQFGAFAVGGANVETILDIMSAGGAIANRFDNTAVTYNRQIGNLLAAYNIHQFALFAQDSWRLSSKFTLDMGIRWEGQFNPQPEANNDAVIQRVSGNTWPIGLSYDPRRINDATRQFAPRIGFAWNPLGGEKKLVIRGQAGLFYAATPMLVFAGPMNNFRVPPGDVSLSLAPVTRPDGTTLTVYQQLLAAGVDLNRTPIGQIPAIPIDAVQRASAFALGGSARDPFIGAAFTGQAADFRNPRSFQTGFGADYELFRNFVVGGQFNYVNTVGLLRNRDLNLPAPTLRANDQTRRPFFGIGAGAVRPVTTVGALTIRDSSARSMYRAGTFQAQYRGKKYTFQAFYTIAENFSDDDSERDAGGFSYVNSFNLRDEYSYSNLDIRHQFTSNATVSLPWGFELGGILRLRSGLPLNARTGGDENRDTNFNDRPFSSAGVPFQRNAFRNRGVVNTDLRVMKNFNLGEKRRIQFSTEIFNLLNADNVIFAGNNNIYGAGLVDVTGAAAPVDPRFMRLRNADGTYDRQNQQVGNPLQVQFGLRFFF